MCVEEESDDLDCVYIFRDIMAVLLMVMRCDVGSLVVVVLSVSHFHSLSLSLCLSASLDGIWTEWGRSPD